ncbi:MAG: glycerophosphodiester phosphodiesterase family protein [Myxococcota bacterium]
MVTAASSLLGIREAMAELDVECIVEGARELRRSKGRARSWSGPVHPSRGRSTTGKGLGRPSSRRGGAHALWGRGRGPLLAMLPAVAVATRSWRWMVALLLAVACQQPNPRGPHLGPPGPAQAHAVATQNTPGATSTGPPREAPSVLSARPGCAPVAAATHPVIAAHRGGVALGPENTLGTFVRALQLGVDQVECDVHLSKDGELVVIHDPDVARTTNGTGEVRRMTLGDIRKLNAAAKVMGHPEQAVPNLGEVLSLVRGKAGVQIEVKTARDSSRYPGIERRLVEVIRSHEMTHAVLVSSFDFPTLREIKAADPCIRTGALVDATWMETRRAASPEQLVMEIIRDTSADDIVVPARTVSRELVQAAHAHGRRIAAWTVNTAARARTLASWGVDALITDDPAALKDALGR